MSIQLIHGDCREVLAEHGPFDMIMADPPYGITALKWDRIVSGWEKAALESIKPTGSMWVWGSLRFFMEQAEAFRAAGWRIAQEIVWEKHNGSNLHNDRFRRVHELAVQFYRKDAPWSGIYNEVQYTHDALQRSVHRRKRKPAHLRGYGEGAAFKSEDGGPRIQRSVIYQRSCHGFAMHETQKPVELMQILINTSCPPGGLVGDFFAGSAAAGEAALLCGRSYVGAEVDPTYFARASERLDALQRRAA